MRPRSSLSTLAAFPQVTGGVRRAPESVDFLHGRTRSGVVGTRPKVAVGCDNEQAWGESFPACRMTVNRMVIAAS
jgi:hypothetical protein